MMGKREREVVHRYINTGNNSSNLLLKVKAVLCSDMHAQENIKAQLHLSERFFHKPETEIKMRRGNENCFQKYSQSWQTRERAKPSQGKHQWGTLMTSKAEKAKRET